MRTKFGFLDRTVYLHSLPPAQRFYLSISPDSRTSHITYEEFDTAFEKSVFSSLASMPPFLKECEDLYGDDKIDDYLQKVIVSVPDIWLTEVIDGLPDPIYLLAKCFRSAPRLGNSKLYIKFLYCLPIGLDEDEFKEALALRLELPNGGSDQLSALQELVDKIDEFLNEREGK